MQEVTRPFGVNKLSERLSRASAKNKSADPFRLWQVKPAISVHETRVAMFLRASGLDSECDLPLPTLTLLVLFLHWARPHALVGREERIEAVCRAST